MTSHTTGKYVERWWIKTSSLMLNVFIWRFQIMIHHRVQLSILYEYHIALNINTLNLEFVSFSRNLADRFVVECAYRHDDDDDDDDDHHHHQQQLI